jgi:hypothetical protein
MLSRDGVPLKRKRTLADKPAYQNGSIDTSFGPPPLQLDSAFNRVYRVEIPAAKSKTFLRVEWTTLQKPAHRSRPFSNRRISMFPGL